MEKNENSCELLNSNVSLFELSSETNLKVNIINNNKHFVDYYLNALENKQIEKIKYFDIDITEDVNDINESFSAPLTLSDQYEEDYLQFKINKYLSCCNDSSYAKRILLQDMNITVGEKKNEENG
ncbi:hypothetical protein MKS88_003153 [Plasmodium brasilianum]|uniref:Uncharacterized protein n=2 Tax=Plasmodium (Plasmodium) TaxID=418103 RepID=A0A1A8VZZ1_PLAMA|nr:conserved Plasmodium protein, unknown function [Plasmodium malariae]KAI4837738.1 hypothetical protein MKS88_003153 [Plasmodium brasilianum]SBS86182.1 conserved Plasmodium protein, unknown function [Plasmodium malariae]SCN44700.1 conserved Plasmodium protein, unknown function [Plasmodium malariae]